MIVANLVFYCVLGEVNGQSSPDQQISMLGANVKLFSVMRRHAELFPKSTKRFWMLALLTAGFTAGMTGVAIAVIHYSF